MSQSAEAYCQSCGMPMAEASHFGTNLDGSRHEEYCTFCYRAGAFITPDMTLEAMIEISAKGWSDSDPGTSYEEALRVGRENIPTLKRWQ